MFYAIYNATTGAIRCTGDTTRDVWRKQLGQPELIISAVDEFTGRKHLTPDVSAFRHGNEIICSVPPDTKDNTHYIDIATGEVRGRPCFLLTSERTFPADGETEYVVSNIPAGTLLTVNGEASTVDDGELHLISNVAKKFSIEFKLPFPYREVMASIEVFAQ